MLVIFVDQSCVNLFSYTCKWVGYVYTITASMGGALLTQSIHVLGVIHVLGHFLWVTCPDAETCYYVGVVVMVTKQSPNRGRGRGRGEQKEREGEGEREKNNEGVH